MPAKSGASNIVPIFRATCPVGTLTYLPKNAPSTASDTGTVTIASNDMITARL